MITVTRLVNTSVISQSYSLCVCVVRTFQMYSPQLSDIQYYSLGSPCYTLHSQNYSPWNYNFIPFDHLHPSCPGNIANVNLVERLQPKSVRKKTHLPLLLLVQYGHKAKRRKLFLIPKEETEHKTDSSLAKASKQLKCKGDQKYLAGRGPRSPVILEAAFTGTTRKQAASTSPTATPRVVMGLRFKYTSGETLGRLKYGCSSLFPLCTLSLVMASSPIILLTCTLILPKIYPSLHFSVEFHILVSTACWISPCSCLKLLKDECITFLSHRSSSILYYLSPQIALIPAIPKQHPGTSQLLVVFPHPPYSTQDSNPPLSPVPTMPTLIQATNYLALLLSFLSSKMFSTMQPA